MKTGSVHKLAGLLTALALCVSGCYAEKKEKFKTADELKDQKPLERPEHDEHDHKAPHDGTLRMVGDHEAQLEFLLDDEAGKLSLYVLDGEAEKPQASEAKEIAVKFSIDGKDVELKLARDESNKKDTLYTVQDDRLKGHHELDGSVSWPRGEKTEELDFEVGHHEEDHDHSKEKEKKGE